MGTLWDSCTKMHEPIKLSSGVESDIDVLDGGLHAPRGMEGFGGTLMLVS